MTLAPERVAEIEADYSAPDSGRFTYVSNGELVELCAAWRELQRVKALDLYHYAQWTKDPDATVHLLTHQCNGYVAIVNESPTSPDPQPLNG